MEVDFDEIALVAANRISEEINFMSCESKARTQLIILDALKSGLDRMRERDRQAYYRQLDTSKGTPLRLRLAR